MHLDIRITLVLAGLLLGSWRRAQEPWRPLLFSLAIEGLLLGSWLAANTIESTDQVPPPGDAD